MWILGNLQTTVFHSVFSPSDTFHGRHRSRTACQIAWRQRLGCTGCKCAGEWCRWTSSGKTGTWWPASASESPRPCGWCLAVPDGSRAHSPWNRQSPAGTGSANHYAARPYHNHRTLDSCYYPPLWLKWFPGRQSIGITIYGWRPWGWHLRLAIRTDRVSTSTLRRKFSVIPNHFSGRIPMPDLLAVQISFGYSVGYIHGFQCFPYGIIRVIMVTLKPDIPYIKRAPIQKKQAYEKSKKKCLSLFVSLKEERQSTLLFNKKEMNIIRKVGLVKQLQH